MIGPKSDQANPSQNSEGITLSTFGGFFWGITGPGWPSPSLLGFTGPGWPSTCDTLPGFTGPERPSTLVPSQGLTRQDLPSAFSSDPATDGITGPGWPSPSFTITTLKIPVDTNGSTNIGFIAPDWYSASLPLNWSDILDVWPQPVPKERKYTLQKSETKNWGDVWSSTQDSIAAITAPRMNLIGYGTATAQKP